MSPTASVAMDAERSAAAVCDVGADARVPHGVPITKDPNTLTQAQVDAMEGRTARLLGGRTSFAARANGSVTVPTHVHVLLRNNGTGGVKDWQIRAQIAVLNKAYAGLTHANAVNTPFRFRLDSIDRTRNTDWFNMNTPSSVEARRALRIGDARHLNIYVTNFGGDLAGLLGFATFPEDYERTPRMDGAVIYRESLPGGNAIFTDDQGTTFNYAQGDTATHEVGHWLNLYHTFQGSCGALNDYVTDTPRQLEGDNIFFCRDALNTCGGPETAKDPVHNFMNYVDDPCMNRFTLGQRDRMNISWFIRAALS
jgi:hypothetical protein